MRFQIGEEKSNAELIKHFEDITPKKYYDIPNIKIKGVNKGPFVHFFNNEKVIVLAGTFRKEDQPKLPSQIEVKRDGENEKYFESFKNTNKSIPIFEYTGTKTWKYIGDFRVKSSKYENDHFILFLQQDKSKEKSDTDQTPNPAQGAGFGHPETNKEVEEKAIKYVTKKYEKEGWVVESKEKDNLGYDLHCTKGLETRFVEVKGVKGNQQSFFITKNEKEFFQTYDNAYIAVVTNALNEQDCNEYASSQIKDVKFENVLFHVDLSPKKRSIKIKRHRKK